MKRIWKELITVFLLVMMMPMLLVNTARLLRGDHEATEATITIHTDTTAAALPQALSVRVLKENGVVEPMELEAYLVGVVLGEMPADFEPEALKAQAVVARTYTLRMRERSAKHDNADVCTQSSCCQSWVSEETYVDRGGTRESVDKVCAAVNETAGLVLTYDGQLIEATYFSSAGGRTEDALAVWGSDVPYLQSTDSPEDGYESRFLETVTMTTSEFRSAMGISLNGPPETWIGDVSYTKGGGVDTIIIGGKSFTGIQMRQLLGLRSTAFVMTAVGDHITITTRGFGHRVGMSQYGAEAMAVDGATYQEILAHYYQGTTLTEFVDKKTNIG